MIGKVNLLMAEAAHDNRKRNVWGYTNNSLRHDRQMLRSHTWIVLEEAERGDRGRHPYGRLRHGGMVTPRTMIIFRDSVLLGNGLVFDFFDAECFDSARFSSWANLEGVVPVSATGA